MVCYGDPHGIYYLASAWNPCIKEWCENGKAPIQSVGQTA